MAFILTLSMKINTYHACSGLKVCSTTVLGATSSLFFTVLPVSVSVSVMHVMPFGHGQKSALTYHYFGTLFFVHTS